MLKKNKKKPASNKKRTFLSVKPILTTDSFVCFYLGQTPIEACVSASASAPKFPLAVGMKVLGFTITRINPLVDVSRNGDVYHSILKHEGYSEE